MESLPIEIVQYILDLLGNNKDISSFMRTCKRHYTLLYIKKLSSVTIKQHQIELRLFSRLVELDISNNKFVTDVSFLKHSLKVLNISGSLSIMKQGGIQNLSLASLVDW